MTSSGRETVTFSSRMMRVRKRHTNHPCRAQLREKMTEFLQMKRTRKTKKTMSSLQKGKVSSRSTYRLTLTDDDLDVQEDTSAGTRVRQTIDSLRDLVGEGERTRREREELASGVKYRTSPDIKVSARNKGDSMPWDSQPVSFGFWIATLGEDEFNQFLFKFALVMFSLPLSILIYGSIHSFFTQ